MISEEEIMSAVPNSASRSVTVAVLRRTEDEWREGAAADGSAIPNSFKS